MRNTILILYFCHNGCVILNYVLVIIFLIVHSSYDGCANTCLNDEENSARQEQENQEPSSPQQPSSVTVSTEEVKIVASEPQPTTYRPVFITPSEDYNTVFDKPSTPPPGLPVLYGPPTH